MQMCVCVCVCVAGGARGVCVCVCVCVNISSLVRRILIYDVLWHVFFALILFEDQ